MVFLDVLHRFAICLRLDCLGPFHARSIQSSDQSKLSLVLSALASAHASDLIGRRAHCFTKRHRQPKLQQVDTPCFLQPCVIF